MKPVLRQLMRYAIVGSCAVMIWFIVLTLAIELFDIHSIVATTVGLIIASIFNYLMQHYWVFEATRPHAKSAPIFTMVTLGGMALNAALFSIASWTVEAMSWLPGWILRIDYLIAQAFSTGVVFLYNFWANRRFTFEVAESGEVKEAMTEALESPAGEALTRAWAGARAWARGR